MDRDANCGNEITVPLLSRLGRAHVRLGRRAQFPARLPDPAVERLAQGRAPFFPISWPTAK
jgi:hypothetical protein